MRAVVLQAPYRVEIADVPIPCPAGEVTVRLEASGICGSDLHAVHGTHPFRHPPVVLGHETAGTVLAVPDPDCGVRPGDRVAIMPSVSCGRCRQCEAGRSQLCPAKRVPGKGDWPGLLAERTTAPATALYPLAEGVDVTEGAMVEPVAVACRATRTAGVAAGNSVAILGAGAIGALIAQVCAVHGAGPVLITDVKQYNLDFAHGLGGATTVNAAREDVVAAGPVVAGPDGFDAVVVASGHPTCLDEALALCRPGGVVVLLPMFDGPLPTGLNPVVLKEIQVRGSTTYTAADFRLAAALVNSRRLDVRPFITRVEPLTAAPEVFTAIENGLDYIKIQFDPRR